MCVYIFFRHSAYVQGGAVKCPDFKCIIKNVQIMTEKTVYLQKIKSTLGKLFHLVLNGISLQ